jgi:hypothetical protein
MYAQDPEANPTLVRVFGLARQMHQTRSAYYDALNNAQRLRSVSPDAQSIDATPWVLWFVQAFTRACVASQAVVRDATDKAHFRLRAAQCHINPRQSKVLTQVRPDGLEDAPQLQIDIDRDKANALGVGFDAINAAIGTALGSSYVNATSGISAPGSLTLSGSISGGFLLTKVGSGTLVLSGSNAQNGLTINQGMVILSGNGSAGTGGNVTLTAGAVSGLSMGNVLRVDNSVATNGNGAASVSGPMTTSTPAARNATSVGMSGVSRSSATPSPQSIRMLSRLSSSRIHATADGRCAAARAT